MQGQQFLCRVLSCSLTPLAPTVPPPVSLKSKIGEAGHLSSSFPLGFDATVNGHLGHCGPPSVSLRTLVTGGIGSVLLDWCGWQSVFYFSGGLTLLWVYYVYRYLLNEKGNYSRAGQSLCLLPCLSCEPFLHVLAPDRTPTTDQRNNSTQV